MSVSLGATDIPLLPALTLLESLVHLSCFMGLEVRHCRFLPHHDAC